MEPNSQYDFITNPNMPQKPGTFGSMSRKKMLLLGGIGAVFLIMTIAILSAIMNSGPTNKDHLLAVAKLQNELIRVSDVALKEASSSEAKNLAITTKLSLRSDQSVLTNALKAQDVKVPKAGKNAKTDQMLTEATQNNRFDQVYMEYTQSQLADYQKKLNTAYKTTVSKKLKETLKTQYVNASVLIGVDPEL